MIHIEVRKKISQARRNGLKVTEISRAFDVSVPTIFRLLKKERETGNLEPCSHKSGRKPELNEDGLEELRQLIITKSDITLLQMKEDLGLEIGISAISAIVVGKLGFRFKKRHYMQAKEIEKM